MNKNVFNGDGRLELPLPRLTVDMFSLCLFRCLSAGQLSDVGDHADYDVCRDISKEILFVARAVQRI